MRISVQSLSLSLSSVPNNTVLTSRPSRHGSHVDQAALVAHVERVGAITENGAVGRARSVILSFDGAVDALHAGGHGAHVHVGGGVRRVADALGECADGVTLECSRRAGCGGGGAG